MLEVVGAVIQEGERVLIAQRLPGKSQGLCWEFPGGKVEPGEAPEAALARELAEELGITVEVGAVFGAVIWEGGGRPLRLTCYRARLVAGTPEPRECHAVRWVALEELDRFDFAPADVPLVRQLQAGGSGFYG